ncbi:hypothetical protein ACWD4K_35060 [Streptomyces gelaticus]
MSAYSSLYNLRASPVVMMTSSLMPGPPAARNGHGGHDCDQQLRADSPALPALPDE